MILKNVKIVATAGVVYVQNAKGTSAALDLEAGADVPTVKVNEVEYTPVLNEETGRYYVDVPTYANKFGNEFVATFGDDTTYSVTYSVNAYVARNYDKYEQGSAMSDLLAAIYNYGVSAVAYVNAE